MTKQKLSLIGLFLITLLSCLSPSAEASLRDSNRIGVGFGLITEPFPSVLGYTLDYNLNERFRLTVGYGTISVIGTDAVLDVTTYGLDAKYFLLPWTFTPFLSGGVSAVTGTVSGVGTTSGFSLSSTGSSFSAGVGIDWQMDWGLTLGFEYKTLFLSERVTAPGFYLAFHF